jgi:uncharacterized protein (TIGR03083 family)
MNEPWLTHLRRETERFADVVTRSPLRVHVPAYPDFTVHSLATHVGRILRLFHGIVTTGSAEKLVIDVPDGEAIADWVLAGLGPLVTALDEVPPDKLVAFPHQPGDHPVALVAPLVTVEIGVHRWDAESVLGEHVPIPAELAVREVESVFANFVPRLAGSGVADIGGTVWLRTTDTASAWTARVTDGRLVTQSEPDDPGDAAVVVSGPAQDIALLVWKRAVPPRVELEVTGSADVLKRFLVTDYIPDPRTTPAH